MNRLHVFFDDFSTCPIGVIGGNYSPDGEYHVVPSMSDTGHWRETVIHHTFRNCSRGNWQVVSENDGFRVLEQTIKSEKLWPILAVGDPAWVNPSVSVQVRPLTQNGIRAVIFRYRTARRFYAAVFENGRIRIVRRDNDVDTEIAEAAGLLDPDRFTQVSIGCTDAGIAVAIDNQNVLRCVDENHGSFFSGCIALSATNLTRFASVHVTAEAVVPEKVRNGSARQIVPRLWRTIKTPLYGTDRNLRIGDIDGDGNPEIVVARRTDRLGGDNCSSITSLAAYRLDGEMMWQWGEPGIATGHTTSDLPFQLHDLNNDGACEVVFCKDWEILMADGRTGKTMQKTSLPLHPSGDGNRVHRIFGDSLHFCDLTGSGNPDCIILKDRYKHAWALDRSFSVLWQWKGSTGHYPASFDIDSDGRDELMIGDTLLDSNGEKIWERKIDDHADNVAVVPLLSNNEYRIILANGDAGLFFFDIQGKQIRHYPIGHAQSLCVARLAGCEEDLSVVCNTFWGAAGITGVFDVNGELRAEFEPMPYASLLQPGNWVSCSGDEPASDLILLSTHPKQGGFIDASGTRRVMFPDDGHPVLCSDCRDIDGDGIDEVLTWNEDEIWIYKADVSGRTPANYPGRNPWYNDSNYRAQISFPVI